MDTSNRKDQENINGKHLAALFQKDDTLLAKNGVVKFSLSLSYLRSQISSIQRNLIPLVNVELFTLWRTHSCTLSCVFCYLIG